MNSPEVVKETVAGYDAAFWHRSYSLLRDALFLHLGQFVHDDDVAEEASFADAIIRVGKALAAVQQDEEGEWSGAIDFDVLGRRCYDEAAKLPDAT